VNALCTDAARASLTEPPALGFRLELAPDLPPVVTDGERLRLVLVNVLTNARHAVAARGDGPRREDAIRLRTSREGGRVIVEVLDCGIGIAEDDLPRVFDPYFTTRRAGTGLGLAISRNLVEGLGGTIAVSSRRGVGTDVRIELPAG
jgi:signal transduction histidine kinase